MSSQHAISGEEMQSKIATARRDAESLKDRIKRRKDELADTSRKFWSRGIPTPGLSLCFLVLKAPVSNASPKRLAEQYRPPSPHWHETPSCPQGALGQDLRHALVDRSPSSGVGFPRWEAHHLGRVHHEQSPCHPPALVVGHDLRLRTERQLRGLWWSGQHLLGVQPLLARWSDTGGAGAFRPFGVSILLPLHQRSSHFDLVWGHDVHALGC